MDFNTDDRFTMWYVVCASSKEKLEFKSKELRALKQIIEERVMQTADYNAYKLLLNPSML